MGWLYRDGKHIEVDESKVYKVNYKDLHNLLVYCQAAGRMAQKLYYHYSDPDWDDGCYDAFCKIYTELKNKYPEVAPDPDFTKIVGH